jgi:hypothetical protein
MNSDSENPRRDHERTDWNLNYVLWGGITLVIAVAIVLAGSWWIFRNFQKSAASRVSGTALAQPILPPEPRLQISPSADWAEMLAREQAILHSYGWVDRSRGIVHIPIEREMEMIAQRGLPAPKSEGGNTK